jgi:hypothetical protein
LLAALLAGCGARETFDAWDTLAFAPIKVAPHLLPEAATPSADVLRGLRHYAAATGVFRDVEGPTTTADETTLVCEPTLVEYAPDAASTLPDRLAGGRARGGAVVEYVFHTVTGTAIAEIDVRSVAREADGWYPDAPPPLGGVDATVEGAGLELYRWLRQQKSNPRAAKRAEPKPADAR